MGKHYFCSHFIRPDLITWSHLIAREAGKCSPYSGWSHAQLNFYYNGRREEQVLGISSGLCHMGLECLWGSQEEVCLQWSNER